MSEEALVWLHQALSVWRTALLAEDTARLHNWCKRYCAQDSPDAPDTEEDDYVKGRPELVGE